MRVVPIFLTTLLLAAPVYAQQASSTSSTPAQSTAVAADQPPAHPVTVEQVHEILELSHAKELAHHCERNAFAMMKRDLPPYMPQDVTDDLQKQLETFDIEPMAVAAYQKHLSTEDAAQIIAFYKTPAGQRLFTAMPAITQEMQQGGTREGMKIAQQVISEHMDEIKAAAAKYQSDHSDTPKITAPN